MQFTLHGSGSLRGIQVDWDADVERGQPMQDAMPGHDVERMQAGLLRKGYVANTVLYPRGTIALREAEGHEIYLQRPVANEIGRPVASPPKRPTLVNHEQGEVFDRYRIIVGDLADGVRIDLVIAAAVPELPRVVVQRLIEDGHVKLAGQQVGKSNRRLHHGDVVEVEVSRVDAN